MSMYWIPSNKTQAAAAMAIVVGGLIMAFALATLLFGGSDASANAESPIEQPSIDVPSYEAPDDLSLTDQLGGIPTGGLPGFPGAGINGLEGLSGEGGIIGLPKVKISLSLTSSTPIAYVGYIVPTDVDQEYTGVQKEIGTSWSLTKTGYGPPDYAQMFSIQSPGGAPVTCTIRIDGRVTESRTTTGPYDQLFCQG